MNRIGIALVLAIFFLACSHGQPQISARPAGLLILSPQKFTSVASLPHEPEAVSSFLSDRGNILKVTRDLGITMEEAQERIHDRRVGLMRLFQRTVEPYFGKVHEVSEICLDNSQLEKEVAKTAEGIFSEAFFSGTRQFVLTPCDEPTNPYSSQFIFLYCAARKELFEIRYFSDRKKRDRIRVACD